MKIVGFVNPNQQLPSPLVSIAQEGDQFVAIYPSLKRYTLTGVNSEVDLKRQPHFIPFEAAHIKNNVTAPVLAFGLTAERVIAGNPPTVKKELRKLVSDSTLDEESLRVIRAYLASADKSMSVGDFVGHVVGVLRLEAFISQRTKKNGTKGERLIVQKRKAAGVKTVYRRNLRSRESGSLISYSGALSQIYAVVDGPQHAFA